MYSNYAKLRDARGMTDFAVSQQTDIAASTLSEWKTGRSVPKMDKMILLADFFGVTVDELVRPLEDKTSE